MPISTQYFDHIQGTLDRYYQAYTLKRYHQARKKLEEYKKKSII